MIQRSELLTNNLKICENCEWCCYHEDEDSFPHCMITGEEKGLIEQCGKFKEKLASISQSEARRITNDE